MIHLMTTPLYESMSRFLYNHVVFYSRVYLVLIRDWKFFVKTFLSFYMWVIDRYVLLIALGDFIIEG